MPDERTAPTPILERFRLPILLLVAVTTLTGGILLLLNRPKPVTITVLPPAPTPVPTATLTPSATPTPEPYLVYITGAVATPEIVVTLPYDSRVLDALHAAGGPLSNADLERVNLAFPWRSFREVLQFRLQSIGTDWATLQELGVWLEPEYHFARRGSAQWNTEVIGPDRRGAPQDGRFDFYSRELACVVGGLSAEKLRSLGITQTGDPVFLPHYEPVVYVGDAEEYPFVLNLITLMSLGSYPAAANLPTLQEISGMTVGETWNSWLEMNPEAAEKLGLQDREMVWVENAQGKRFKVRLRLVPGVRPDVVNLPYNQGHRAIGRWARDRGVNGLELMALATEPVSGLAALTGTRVRVYRA